MTTPAGIDSVMQENRVFPPPADFASRIGGVHVPDLAAWRTQHERSIRDPEGFWGEVAKGFHWFKPWGKVLEWNLPDAKWFVGGQTNACFNAVDRQVEQGHGDEVAIIWEGEPNAAGPHGHEVRHITYRELRDEVARCAAALESLGVHKGDVVTLYMGMVPELAIAVLACARLGAPHSVIFGGFAAQAIVDRVHDAQSKVIVTCDGAHRRGTLVPLKANVDAACERLPHVAAAEDCDRAECLLAHGALPSCWSGVPRERSKKSRMVFQACTPVSRKLSAAWRLPG